MSDEPERNEGPRFRSAKRKLEPTEREGIQAIARKLGAARREAFGLEGNEVSEAIRKEITAIAGKHNMIVEWSLRPAAGLRWRLKSEGEGICACTCGCACSCSCTCMA